MVFGEDGEADGVGGDGGGEEVPGARGEDAGGVAEGGGVGELAEEFPAVRGG